MLHSKRVRITETSVTSPNEARPGALPPGMLRHATGAGLRFLQSAARKLSTAWFWVSRS